jgi:hypothetical protein
MITAIEGINNYSDYYNNQREEQKRPTVAVQPFVFRTAR